MINWHQFQMQQCRVINGQLRLKKDKQRIVFNWPVESAKRHLLGCLPSTCRGVPATSRTTCWSTEPRRRDLETCEASAAFPSEDVPAFGRSASARSTLAGRSRARSCDPGEAPDRSCSARGPSLRPPQDFERRNRSGQKYQLH